MQKGERFPVWQGLGLSERRLQKMKASLNSRKPFLFQIFIIQKTDSG